MENNKNEIDLFELFVKTLLFFRKYKYILIGSILLGFILGYVKSTINTKLYKSHITVESNNKAVFISLLESLNDDLNSQNLNTNMNLPEDKAEKITLIEPEIFYTDDEQKNEIPLFKIHVTVSDTSIFNDITKGLRYMAENNIYLDRCNQIKLSQKIEMVNNIDDEIKKIDSLRINQDFQNLLIESGSSASEQIIKFSKEKQRLERYIKLSEPLIIIKKFNKTIKPINSTLKTTFISGFILFFLGFILSLILESRKYIKKYEDKK